MAICVIAVARVAPCQCFSPGSNHTTSPGRMSSTAPPQRCTQPGPDVTIRVWPSGCVCQAVRAPGSNVTLAPRTRAGSGASNKGSTRTAPVKYSAGPFPEGREPLRLISMALCSFAFQPSLAGCRWLQLRAREGEQLDGIIGMDLLTGFMNGPPPDR